MGKCQMVLNPEKGPDDSTMCDKETENFWIAGQAGKMFICEEHANGGPPSGHVWHEVEASK